MINRHKMATAGLLMVGTLALVAADGTANLGAVRLAGVAFAFVFLVAAYLNGRRASEGPWRGRSVPLAYFLSLWVPLVLSILVLNLLGFAGLIDETELNAQPTSDLAELLERFISIFLYVLALVELFNLGRSLDVVYGSERRQPAFAERKGLAMLVVAVVSLYMVVVNPPVLLLLLPLFFWIFIEERQGTVRLLNLLLFVLGGLMVFALAIYMAVAVMHNGPWVIWFFIALFSLGKISIWSGVLIMAILAAGLTLIVAPPRARTQPAGEPEAAVGPESAQ